MEINDSRDIFIMSLIAFIAIGAFILGFVLRYLGMKKQDTDTPTQADYSSIVSPEPSSTKVFNAQDMLRLVGIMGRSNNDERLSELRNWRAETMGSELTDILSRYIAMYETLSDVNLAVGSSNSYLVKADRKKLKRLVNSQQFDRASQLVDGWRSDPRYQSAIAQLTQLKQGLEQLQSSFSNLTKDIQSS